jgi:HSP20 family molecular chaperone IbpA
MRGGGGGRRGGHHGRWRRRGGPFGRFGFAAADDSSSSSSSSSDSEDDEIVVSPRKCKGSPARFQFTWGQSTKQDDEKKKRKIAPAVDVYSLEESYVVVASVAGAIASEITVDFNTRSHELTLGGVINSGMKNISKQDLDKRRRIAERSVGEFERTIRIPAEPAVDEDHIRAKYNNGLLKVTLPKIQPTQPEKRQYSVSLDAISDTDIEETGVSEKATAAGDADPEVSVPSDSKSEITLSDDGVVVEKP